jgi:hypothetical protein
MTAPVSKSFDFYQIHIHTSAGKDVKHLLMYSTVVLQNLHRGEVFLGRPPLLQLRRVREAGGGTVWENGGNH